MKQLIVILAVALSSVACASTPEKVQQSRQSLSSYALAQCLHEAYPQEPRFTADAKQAAGAWHFMGRGQHRIVQDEQTLDVLHDPYAAVSEYILKRSVREPAVMKRGAENSFASCLQILWSSNFEALVREQDRYIGD